VKDPHIGLFLSFFSKTFGGDVYMEKQTVGQKVKGHFKKHKTKYMVVGGVVVVGGTSFYLGRKYPEHIKSISMDVVNEISPTNVAIGKDIKIENKTEIVNNVTNTINMGGYTTKLVECVEDGVIYGSVKQAAKAAGVSKEAMSKCINGHTDVIDGKHYAIKGLGTVKKDSQK
jgi:hypothetical protein